MPTTSTINPVVEAITSQTLTYSPAVLAGVQAAEVSKASGAAKSQAVVNAIIAGSAIGASAPNANVAAISALVNLIVSVLNATGVFTHKSPQAAPAPATLISERT